MRVRGHVGRRARTLPALITPLAPSLSPYSMSTVCPKVCPHCQPTVCPPDALVNITTTTKINTTPMRDCSALAGTRYCTRRIPGVPGSAKRRFFSRDRGIDAHRHGSCRGQACVAPRQRDATAPRRTRCKRRRRSYAEREPGWVGAHGGGRGHLRGQPSHMSTVLASLLLCTPPPLHAGRAGAHLCSPLSALARPVGRAVHAPTEVLLEVQRLKAAARPVCASRQRRGEMLRAHVPEGVAIEPGRRAPAVDSGTIHREDGCRADAQPGPAACGVR